MRIWQLHSSLLHKFSYTPDFVFVNYSFTFSIFPSLIWLTRKQEFLFLLYMIFWCSLVHIVPPFVHTYRLFRLVSWLNGISKRKIMIFRWKWFCIMLYVQCQILLAAGSGARKMFLSCAGSFFSIFKQKKKTFTLYVS